MKNYRQQMLVQEKTKNLFTLSIKMNYDKRTRELKTIEKSN